MNSVMTPRLLTICSFVKQGSTVIDVGSDHAYVPIFLVKEGIAAKALATDVKEGPIQRSRENVMKMGLRNKIDFQKANGLRGVSLTEANTIIIAGMGGLLIADIISGAEKIAEQTFILQPMTAIAELRAFLLANGFAIKHEKLCLESEKLYTVMEVVRGEERPYSETELILGRRTKDDVLYPLLVKRETEKIKKRIEGLENAKTQNMEEIEKLKKIWMEMK